MAATAYRMRFNEMFGYTKDILMFALEAVELKRSFFAHYERLNKDGLCELVRQQTEQAKSGDDFRNCGE